MYVVFMNKTHAAVVAAHEAGYRVDKRGNLVTPDGEKNIPGRSFTHDGQPVTFMTFLAYCVHGEESFGNMYSIRPGAVPRPDTLVRRQQVKIKSGLDISDFKVVPNKPRQASKTLPTEMRYHERCGKTTEHRQYSQGKRPAAFRCVPCSRRDGKNQQIVKDIRNGLMTFDRYIA